MIAGDSAYDTSFYDKGRSGPEPLPITVETLRMGAGEKKRVLLPVWKPSDFGNFEPAADFVLMGECHLTRGNLTVLGGWPGVGKSRAALALAIAGARGADWLGHPVHSRFRTLIIQCENGPFRLKSELNEAVPEGGLDEWLRITPPPPYGLAFADPAFRAELRQHIAEWKPGLVIIDPWNRVSDGDKQADYRTALDAVHMCLPESAAEKPAILVIHHMRKKGSDSVRKHGRDLLHELAGSYQIGSSARCVFALEPGSSDVTDSAVVLTCCKNNDGREGSPTAWHRRNGLFEPHPEFDLEGFLEGDEGVPKAKELPVEAVTLALRGMCGESRGSAVSRLVSAGVCERTKAYWLIKQFPGNIEEDSSGKLWWREDGES